MKLLFQYLKKNDLFFINFTGFFSEKFTKEPISHLFQFEKKRENKNFAGNIICKVVRL